MEAISVTSFSDLMEKTAGMERALVLVYKPGAEQSDCALGRLRELDAPENLSLFTVDVTRTRDIHPRFGVDSAPSLLVLRDHKMVQIFKGCQTAGFYDAVVSGRSMGTVADPSGKEIKQVTVYTTPTCSWCTTLKTYLDSQQVKYREVNIADDTSAAQAMVQKSGQQGVPQTEINGQMVVGFDKPRINQLLEIT